MSVNERFVLFVRVSNEVLYLETAVYFPLPRLVDILHVFLGLDDVWIIHTFLELYVLSDQLVCFVVSFLMAFRK
jgi:hypothetical protein